jgi:two-component system phosphate regulon response regulator PhoB
MTAPATQAQERILVVDDEPDIVALVAYHLAKSNYRVTTASNGTDALSIARSERPSLLVLDLMLPGMSGFDVLAHLRAEETTRSTSSWGLNGLVR